MNEPAKTEKVTHAFAIRNYVSKVSEHLGEHRVSMPAESFEKLLRAANGRTHNVRPDGVHVFNQNIPNPTEERYKGLSGYNYPRKIDVEIVERECDPDALRRIYSAEVKEAEARLRLTQEKFASNALRQEVNRLQEELTKERTKQAKIDPETIAFLKENRNLHGQLEGALCEVDRLRRLMVDFAPIAATPGFRLAHCFMTSYDDDAKRYKTQVIKNGVGTVYVGFGPNPIEAGKAALRDAGVDI